MPDRDVGEMGEKVLEQWAAENGAIANKAGRDRAGWDYLLEMVLRSPVQPQVSLPLDRQQPPLRCLVQVKSTDGRPGSVAVKLDNPTGCTGAEPSGAVKNQG